jgi:hypothetical protein
MITANVIKVKIKIYANKAKEENIYHISIRREK